MKDSTLCVFLLIDDTEVPVYFRKEITLAAVHRTAFLLTLQTITAMLLRPIYVVCLYRCNEEPDTTNVIILKYRDIVKMESWFGMEYVCLTALTDLRMSLEEL